MVGFGACMLSIWRQVSRHSHPITLLQISRASFSHSRTLFQADLHSNTHHCTYVAAVMVVALGPGKFYGSSLPRPRFYTDVKLNNERVDPPLPVMDALMSWAEEAHWSMGGLNFTRHRLQGRIEGNVEKLRAQREKIFNKSPKRRKSVKESAAPRPDKDKNMSKVSQILSPPPAPVAIKRRRVVGLLDEDEEQEVVVKRGPVRKLGDDFDRVARESGMTVTKAGKSSMDEPPRTRSKSDRVNEEADAGRRRTGKRKLVKGGKTNEGKMAAAGARTSTRLAKLTGSG